MGMQGWRRTMEDSHIANLDIGDGVSIFGVFDGHGGTIVLSIKFYISYLFKFNKFLITILIGSEVA